MRFKNRNIRVAYLPGLVFLLILAMSSPALAQGSIFGTVSNSDLTTPINGEISFLGFLDDTDEEVRIESCDGAGYDAGNWFDDFQNYLTEAPGNPYDYYFYNIFNGEGFHLAKLIPNNSFQQEDITLGANSWPTVPTGLTGQGVSLSSVLLTWNGQAGLTYHVYRRAATSNGSFFRLDNIAGDLADPGVVDSFFVDVTVDGVSSYDYLIIAEDASGNYSRHSTVITVNSGTLVAPVLDSITPDNGSASGGTLVNLYGTGFDVNGVTVQIGSSSPITGTVISPHHVTAITPAGTVGPANVWATNDSSGLTSNMLSGGFTYNANSPPVLASIGPKAAIEGEMLTFTTSATDPEGDTPVMTSSTPPGSATYIDSGNGTGLFEWQTIFTDAGDYYVTFYAVDSIDPALVDSEIVTITITESGNHPPVLASINDTSIAEGDSLTLLVSATDPDGEVPALSGTNLPTNANFTDSGNGTGLFEFNPDLTQAGVYDVVFKAVDSSLELDSIVVQITVTETNQLPVLAAIDPKSTTENIPLTFVVNATDPDGTTPILSTDSLPAGAVFTDSLNGSGLFEWTPSYIQAGSYNVTFYAADAVYPTDVDSEVVVITVDEAGNQPPVLDSIGPQIVVEGYNLNFIVSATDPDGTIPVLSAIGLPANATFVDSGDGTGTFDFSPDFMQAGLYTITFIADDSLLADSEVVDITVTETGNVPPVFDPINDTTVNEADTLVIVVHATDPDGGAVFPALSVSTTLNNYTFVDSGNGTGTLTYTPDFFDAGVDTVFLFAADFGTPRQTGGTNFIITTNDVNQPPEWVAAGPFGVVAGDTLQFTVVATDSTDPNPANRLFLSVLILPTNASFVDNGDGTGTFTFAPDTTQEGIDTVTFLAVDQETPQLSATLPVEIEVVVENIPPVLDPIGPQTILEGEILLVFVSATDPDGPDPQLLAEKLPPNSNFDDNGDGTGVFTFFPNYVQAGLASVTIKAYDGFAIDKEVVLIQIYEAGDQFPVFDSVPSPSVTEGDTLEFVVTAYDPDQVGIAFSTTESSLPPFASMVDSGNGVAAFTVTPAYVDSGTYDIGVIADDGILADTIVVTLTVIEAGNQPPVLDSIADQTILETGTLAFTVTASDPDGTLPLLYTDSLPDNATFTDNSDGTGDFEFTPDLTQAGEYQIMFYATDTLETDSQLVTITVEDNNQLPFVFTPGNQTIYEGDTLTYVVTSYDADGTMPFLDAYLDGTVDSLPPNMTFDDPRDGTGTLTFIPDHTQGGPVSLPAFYDIIFEATDEVYTDVSQTSKATIKVIDRNFTPEIELLDGTPPYSVTEGDTLEFRVAANDVDGTAEVSALDMPTNSEFDGIQGLKTFLFYPDYTQAGTYFVTFVAIDDDGASDTLVVQIDVLEAGNQSPYFTTELPFIYYVQIDTLTAIVVRASDPDMDSLTLTGLPLWSEITASFIDSGNGVGIYYVLPDMYQADNTFDVTFTATDPSGASDTITTTLWVVSFLRGDIDNNSKYTMNDLAWLIAYLYRGGPPPLNIEAADVDGDGDVNIGDVTYLILFLYHSGPQPPQ